jgi:hypothetical protein
MSTALIACLYLAPIMVAFGVMAWVADVLERWHGGDE